MLPATQYQDILEDLIKMLPVKGAPEIRNWIRSQLPNVTPSEICRLIKKAESIRKSNGPFLGMEEVKAIHIFRYNQMVIQLLATKDYYDLNNDQRKGLDANARYKLLEKKKGAYIDCINGLAQKEALLGFHNRDFLFEINFQSTIVIENDESNIDIDRLTIPEQDEYLELAQKAKVGAYELRSVSPSSTAVTQELTVVVGQSVDERPNIDGIRVIEAHRRAEIENELRRFTPQQRLLMTLERLNLKRLKEAGASLDEREEKILNGNIIDRKIQID